MSSPNLTPAEHARNILERDRAHVWHPYSSFLAPSPTYPVASANGVRLTLTDGRTLIDGMSSWWSVLHGYNHPTLNQALLDQSQAMSHVMFGGLTHEPAVTLSQKLVQLSPEGLNKVFLSDSGSVSVEVAMKMALQYWHSQGRPEKNRFLALKNGYHGDTFGAMSVCDPVTGMHHLFAQNITQQYFAERPQSRFSAAFDPKDLDSIRHLLATKTDIAAVILEPVVQGAGGMWMYSPTYVREVRVLCDQYDVLLIADEIATGLGRTGKLFACEHANISPDIMCLGKTLTGGYMTLAATLCNDKVSDGICQGDAGVFMHGPTFMGNPLACAVANASIDLLLASDWQSNIARIDQQLKQGLEPCRELEHVVDVRVLGAIGVVELDYAPAMAEIQPALVDEGIWVRPFGKLVYIMPPYVATNQDLHALTGGIFRVVGAL
ncbi:adenosylmethionine--8-amino-7-oxononanoate transaminase [Gilvimarinus sp. SDUM040013]|uniref:Adenosylmethionine-8-amino-7-oxononanoate aminotransferase n=1 Tax=Gilvimarinus gilvus TaxID=3058038 RepID=A0ABU4RUB4_9GAMM|nr:adenosylmethionine--8-amino-7-oxononanoate transaminase [Gilvimarinus sp. SDUM040013]MDO3385097.1 adenosylmethionine--8-amino-7-oxononanoate transaminase [Gilvimarinus sp. SDUM040013]MDX6848472.1 adenosylmethionine--8-amino-7-oxononanoate transaminase [Gilvimarinus sp. SDUM040013]